MSFLKISFVFHDSQVFRNGVFKPITFFLGVILVLISPKAMSGRDGETNAPSEEWGEEVR